MGHRTQIILEDAQYERLMNVSRASGVGLGELIRRAVDRMYGTATIDEFEEAVTMSFGAWKGRALDGAEYVESLRRARADRFPEW